jgi:predicted alpha/beta hydrolase family esterase
LVGISKDRDQVLVVPGLYNSGPGHWQTLWEKEFGFARVEQAEWDVPRCVDWVRTLNEVIMAQDVPVVLVAHSLGCIAVGHWAAEADKEAVRKIKGALLVAPSDCERQDFPPGAVGFKPISREILPFRSVVVASTTDPYIPIGRSEELAGWWGSEFVNVGACGHITTADGFGAWPQGLALLDELRRP